MEWRALEREYEREKEERLFTRRSLCFVKNATRTGNVFWRGRELETGAWGAFTVLTFHRTPQSNQPPTDLITRYVAPKSHSENISVARKQISKFQFSILECFACFSFLALVLVIRLITSIH